jgi:hypothetical protein
MTPQPPKEIVQFLVSAVNTAGKTVTIKTRTPWLYGASHFTAGRFKLAKATIQRLG